MFGKCAAGFMFEVGGEVLFDEGLGQQFFTFGQAVCEAVCFGGGCGIVVVLVSGVQALRSKAGEGCISWLVSQQAV